MGNRKQLTAEQKAKQKKAALVALGELRRLNALHNESLFCAFGIHEIIEYSKLPIAFGPLGPYEMLEAIAELSELILLAEVLDAAPAPLKAVA